MTVQRTRGPVTEKIKKKMMDREVPYHEIPDHQKPLYHGAEKAEWAQWLKTGCVKVLTRNEAGQIRKTIDKRRIIRLRFVYRDKNCSLLMSINRSK